MLGDSKNREHGINMSTYLCMIGFSVCGCVWMLGEARQEQEDGVSYLVLISQVCECKISRKALREGRADAEQDYRHHHSPYCFSVDVKRD